MQQFPLENFRFERKSFFKLSSLLRKDKLSFMGFWHQEGLCQLNRKKIHSSNIALDFKTKPHLDYENKRPKYSKELFGWT